MGFSSKLFILTFFGFVSVACASKFPQAPEANYKRHLLDGFYRKDRFGDEFLAHTKREFVQAEFDNAVLFDVTHWALPVREAFIEEMKRIYRLPESEVQILETTELKEEENFVTFIVSASTRRPEWRDFERGNSIWRILLESPDGTIQLRPTKTERVNERDERNRFFYRSMSRFATTYRVNFSRREIKGLSEAVLRIASPVGQADFNFDISLQPLKAQARR